MEHWHQRERDAKEKHRLQRETEQVEKSVDAVVDSTKEKESGR